MDTNNRRLIWCISICAAVICTAIILSLIPRYLQKTPEVGQVIAERALPANSASVQREEARWGFPSDGGVPRPGFTVKLNGSTRQPDWVLWKVDHSGSINRSGYSWRNDQNVPVDRRQKALWYAGTHWHADGIDHETTDSRLEIGHQKPSDNSKQSAEIMQACMVLEDNLCPQTSRLNQVVWKALESWVTKTSETPTVDVWCVTGPLWYAEEGDTYTVQVLGDGVPVPTHFFKVCLITHKHSDIELKAWILPNTDKPPAGFDDGAVTTARVQQLAGLDFWNAIPDEQETELESKK